MNPPADIKKEHILELAARFWKVSEIAGFFRVAVSTLYNHVTAEELQQAREKGKGDLRELAWKVAAKDSGIKILHHMLQFHLDELVQTRGKLGEVSNEELAAEVQRRVSAAKLIQSGEWKSVLTKSVDDKPKKLSASLSPEATGKEPDGDKSDDDVK